MLNEVNLCLLTKSEGVKHRASSMDLNQHFKARLRLAKDYRDKTNF